MDDRMNDVIDEVQKRLGEEYEVKRVEVMKNNDTKLKGIQVRRKDMNVAKIYYSVRTVESVCFSRIITERKENLIPLLIWESKKTTVTENTKILMMKGFCMTI
jgi:hypothetical protein